MSLMTDLGSTCIYVLKRACVFHLRITSCIYQSAARRAQQNACNQNWQKVDDQIPQARQKF